MASFHLNVFFNCPFFSRSIRSTCKEKNKQKPQPHTHTHKPKNREKTKKQGRTEQSSFSPLSWGKQKFRDWQITHWDTLFTQAPCSLWFWVRISKTAALFRRAGVFAKTQKTPVFLAISMKIQQLWKIPNTKGETLPILKKDTAQTPQSSSSSLA